MLEAIRRRASKKMRSKIPGVLSQQLHEQQRKEVEEEPGFSEVIRLRYGAGPLQWSQGARALEWSQRQERITRHAQEAERQEREDLEATATAYRASRSNDMEEQLDVAKDTERARHLYLKLHEQVQSGNEGRTSALLTVEEVCARKAIRDRGHYDVS